MLHSRQDAALNRIVSVAETRLHASIKSLSTALEDMALTPSGALLQWGPLFMCRFCCLMERRGSLLTQPFSHCLYESACKHTPKVWQVFYFENRN